MDLLELLTDYDANGSFADMAKNVNTTDGSGYAWYVRITDLENPKPLSELKYVDKLSYEFLKKTELHGGELLMAKRGDIGKVYIFEPRTKYATVAPNMYLLKLNNKVIPHFLYDYFVSDEGNKKLARLNASSTMGALYKDDVKNIDVIMPSIEEQLKIGIYFQSLDHLITLHQRKCDEVKSLKKYMLQKMFPQNEQKVPEIRFEGFTEAWEQRKLGELVKEGILEAPLDGNHGEKHPTSDEYVESGIPFLMASDIHNGEVNIYSCKYITKERAERLDKGFARNGDVLLTHKATIGETAILSNLMTEYAMLTPQVTYYRIKNEERLNREYLYSFFNSLDFQTELKTKAAQSTRPYIGITAQQNLKIILPTEIDEQRKIGLYFGNLDRLITLHQQKCEELKKIKKFMLQKMFV